MYKTNFLPKDLLLPEPVTFVFFALLHHIFVMHCRLFNALLDNLLFCLTRSYVTQNYLLDMPYRLTLWLDELNDDHLGQTGNQMDSLM